LFAVIGVGLLSACTVEADGFAGVTVDSHGVITAVVQTCRHSVDGATLYWSDGPEGPDGRDTVMGEWAFSRSTAGQYVSWPLDAPHAEGVRATAPLKPLAEGRTYSLYGWTHDNSWSTANVEFTLENLRSLPAGHVLVLDAGEQSRELSLQEFSDLPCSESRSSR
jgi:hypothetical protein